MLSINYVTLCFCMLLVTVVFVFSIYGDVFKLNLHVFSPGKIKTKSKKISFITSYRHAHHSPTSYYPLTNLHQFAFSDYVGGSFLSALNSAKYEYITHASY